MSAYFLSTESLGLSAVQGVAVLLLGFIPNWAVAQEQPAHTKAEADKAGLLVQKLGDGSFSVRERASKELIRLGKAAVPALTEGLKSGNAEIHHRCEAILPLALGRELDEKLIAFIADKGGKSDHGLVGWKRFQQITGDDKDGRELFAEMWKAEPALLPAIPNKSEEIDALFQQRYVALHESLKAKRASHAQFAALLFASIERSQPMIVLDFVFKASPSALDLSPNGKSRLTRKLLVHWIERQPDPLLPSALRLMVVLQLSEALPVALEKAADPKASSATCAAAAYTVGMLGNKEHLPALNKLMSDCRSVGSFIWKDGDRWVNGTSEVRDVAFAASCRLTRQTPSHYGFAVRDDEYSFTLAMVRGFTDSAHREAALAKWKAWRKTHPDNLK